MNTVCIQPYPLTSDRNEYYDWWLQTYSIEMLLNFLTMALLQRPPFARFSDRYAMPTFLMASALFSFLYVAERTLVYVCLNERILFSKPGHLSAGANKKLVTEIRPKSANPLLALSEFLAESVPSSPEKQSHDELPKATIVWRITIQAVDVFRSWKVEMFFVIRDLPHSIKNFVAKLGTSNVLRKLIEFSDFAPSYVAPGLAKESRRRDVLHQICSID